MEVAFGKAREMEMGRWRPKKADSLTSTPSQYVRPKARIRRLSPSSRRWFVGGTKGTLFPKVAVDGCFSFFSPLDFLPAPCSSVVAF